MNECPQISYSMKDKIEESRPYRGGFFCGYFLQISFRGAYLLYFGAYKLLYNLDKAEIILYTVCNMRQANGRSIYCVTGK